MVVTARPRLKPIALPTEHGGWGLLGAPILLGLLLAPSASGAWLALAALGAFLTRQPLRLTIGDLRRGKRYPRTVWAARFAALYGSIAAAGFALSLAYAEHSTLAPMALIAIFAPIQFAHDLKGESRHPVAEVAGSLAVAPLATAILLLGGLEQLPAWLLGAMLAIHSLTALAYIRTRLRLGRGEKVDARGPIALHALGVVLAAAMAPVLGWTVVAAFVVLLGRAWWGLSRFVRPVSAPMVGVQEILYTLLVVLSAAAGAWL